MTLLVQITDTHIFPPGKLLYGNTDTAAHLGESVRQINAMRPIPDVVLITGDLVEQGDEVGYQHFIELIKPLEMPTYVIPGNHDNPQFMLEVFAGTSHFPATDDTFQYAIEDFPYRILALNSHCDGTELPEFGEKRLSWLQDQLSSSDKPATSHQLIASRGLTIAPSTVVVAGAPTLHHYIDGDFLSGSNLWPANVEERRIDKESGLSWDELKKYMMGSRYQSEN